MVPEAHHAAGSVKGQDSPYLPSPIFLKNNHLGGVNLTPKFKLKTIIQKKEEEKNTNKPSGRKDKGPTWQKVRGRSEGAASSQFNIRASHSGGGIDRSSSSRTKFVPVFTVALAPDGVEGRCGALAELPG